MILTLVIQFVVFLAARTEFNGVFSCNLSKNAAYAVRFLSQRSTDESTKTMTTGIPSQILIQPYFVKNNRTEKLERIASELRILQKWNQERQDQDDHKLTMNHTIIWMEKLVNNTHDFLNRWKFPSEYEETLMDVTMDETERTLNEFNDRLPPNVKLEALNGYIPRWTQESVKSWPNMFAGGNYFYICYEWQNLGKIFLDCALCELLSGDPDVPDNVPKCPIGFVRLPTGICRNMRISPVTDY